MIEIFKWYLKAWLSVHPHNPNKYKQVLDAFDAGEDLEHNYCRNPPVPGDNTERPWWLHFHFFEMVKW